MPTFTLMIIKRIQHICKAYSKINSIDEVQLYRKEAGRAFRELPPCPSCGAPAHSYHKDGSYLRHLVTFHDGTVSDTLVCVRCACCPSCGHSHAVLPAVIIPYSSFSPCFLIALLFSYYTHRFPNVAALCSAFGISVKTFYRIRRAFLSDRHILASVDRTLEYLTDVETACTLYAWTVLHLFRSLYLFSLSAGHGFLQPKGSLRQKTRMPGHPPGIPR